jgi:hypothetical protein
MRRFVPIASLGIAFSLPFSLSGQSVCMKNGQLCSLEESKEAQNQLCDAEAAPVNLTIAEPVKLSGGLVDDIGEPVVLGRVIPGLRATMQIRDLREGSVLLSAPLNEEGRFEFDQVPAGAFRLIAVSEKLGGFRRIPLIEQPKLMACSGATECHVEAVVHYRGDDDPIDLCPPK